MYAEIVQVVPNPDHTVTVFFADGKIVRYDAAHLLKLEVFKMVMNIISMIVFLKIIKSPLAIAISFAFSYTVSFFVEWFVASRQLQYSVRNIIIDFMPSFAVAWFMGIVVLAIGKLNLLPALELVLHVASGIILYFTVTYLLRFPQAEHLLNMVIKKINR